MTFGEALAAMVTALSAADLERAGVTYEVLVGDEHIDAQGAPPRVVIIPGSSQPAAAYQQPARPGPRSIAGELHAFTAELWAKMDPTDPTTVGRDYIAVSTMRATFNMAMRATFGPAYQLGQGSWSATRGESVDEDGRRFDQQFTLYLALLDAPTTVQSVQHTTLNIGSSSPGTDYTAP